MLLYYPIGYIINILKFIISPLISIFRFKARVYVYNYFISHGDNYLLPRDLQLNGSGYYTWCDRKKQQVLFIPKIRVNRFCYLLYFWLVWIYSDDNNYDIINIKACTELNLGEKDFTTITSILANNGTILSNFKYGVSVTKHDNSIYLFYYSMFYSSNNFFNYFKYSKTPKTIWNIGYKEKVEVNGLIRYKYRLWVSNP